MDDGDGGQAAGHNGEGVLRRDRGAGGGRGLVRNLLLLDADGAALPGRMRRHVRC